MIRTVAFGLKNKVRMSINSLKSIQECIENFLPFQVDKSRKTAKHCPRFSIRAKDVVEAINIQNETWNYKKMKKQP